MDIEYLWQSSYGTEWNSCKHTYFWLNWFCNRFVSASQDVYGAVAES